MEGVPRNLRQKVAREAADLLYLGLENEFKQAKRKAAGTLNASFLPTNLEIALELDRIAEEREGPARDQRLVKMRREALRIMGMLNEYQPLLVGSVWRGTLHCGSDIDIVAYHDDPQDVLRILKRHSIKITHTEWVAVTKKGKRKQSFHMYAESPSGENMEIKVSSQEEMWKTERCEIYRDNIIGLDARDLEILLKENPTQRFVPDNR